MDKENFLKEVINTLRSSFGNGWDISINYVPKNNGVVYTSICIKKEDENISPTIYIDGYYQRYKEGTSIENIVTEIIQCYENATAEDSVSLNVNNLFDWEQVKDLLIVRVISEEKNSEMLKNHVWRKYLNLALLPVIALDSSDSSLQSIKLTRDLAKAWNIDDDVIIDTAIENSKTRFPSKCRNLFDVIAGTMNIKSSEMSDNPMWVLSNSIGINGASVILDDEFLREKYDEIGDSYFIIPSSVHELIVIPTKNVNAEDMLDLIKSVNADVVLPEEVLSDSLYLYNGSEVELVL